MRQLTFACQPSFEKYARVSRREHFLNTMESVVPWSELEALIEPHYPKAGRGRHPVALGTMLRIYFLQHWFNLSRLRKFGQPDEWKDCSPAAIKMAETRSNDGTTSTAESHSSVQGEGGFGRVEGG